jgi:tetratricopeptide (TPR) repeat protein/TolB-like protein/tRNA A-37 threonylcarbamoyl transferase component Bud32
MDKLDSREGWIGRKLSHYTLLEELHRGEVQIVYRARDDKLNREVALKVLPPELVQEPERRQRFVSEAKASASLEHPHVGVIHEIDESDGVVFIAMELMRGPSLASRLAQGPLPLSEAIRIGIGVASGLAYAHERGIVHRDVKPANVMLTEEGHPKLIDFGLAKLLDVEQSPFFSQTGEDEPSLQSATREGLIQGTVPFMSPEQARGGRVDHRSDVFSFGLLLYTMLSGRPPFEGTSRIDTLHAILREPTPRLAGVSGEARDLLQPIIDRCLQKEPDRRYPTMAEPLQELKRARVRIEAGGRLSRGARRTLWAAAIAAAAAIAFLIVSRRPVDTEIDETPSIAVLEFENLSGDPGLDWLATGLPDMLATDLSQSPELEVVGLGELYPVLAETGGLEGVAPTRELISEIASRTGVRSVLTGSFARAGDTLRISARLEEARTGKVLMSETAEAVGEENLFRLVDEITSRIKERYDLTPPGEGLDRDLRDVTTASVEAYREYAEGIRLHERFREEEAAPHFQRAIELDPGFAMALAKLGVVMSNLGRHEEGDEYAEKALEHVDRLSERERLYIEGWYASRKPSTIDKAIESYERAIERYPDHGSARHNLGNLLFTTERYEEAIEQLEELRSRGMMFPATYEQLAQAYMALDDVDSAREVLREFSERNPDDWTTLLSLAQIEIETGDLEGGARLLERAEALGATPMRILPVRWAAHIFAEEWDEAGRTAAQLMESGEPVEKFIGGRLMAVTALYQGEVGSVLRALDRHLVSAEGGESDFRIQPALLKSRILLEIGEFQEAKEAALSVSETEDHYGASHTALALAAIAAQRLGDSEEAEELSREYRRRINPALGAAPERLHHFLQGELAMERGEYDHAVAEFEESESMLPPRGSEGIHTLIWYSLATAHRLSGNDGEALGWYQRIVESREERLFEPIRYVRSFYFLGKLRDAEGESEGAHEGYQRFLDHFENGEIDRDLVREAEGELR